VKVAPFTYPNVLASYAPFMNAARSVLLLLHSQLQYIAAIRQSMFPTGIISFPAGTRHRSPPGVLAVVPTAPQ
jgi:hypothetical protein